MIAAWMLYTLLIGALVGVAGLAFERLAIALRWPVRFVWLAAVAASLAWPALSIARTKAAPEAQGVALIPFTINVQQASTITAGPAGSDRAARVDVALGTAWVLATAFLLLRLSVALRVLGRRRRSWRRDEVDGVEIRLSDDVGPAVVGIRSMDVVLPEWILSLDQPLRAMVLRHEEEHRAARDPYLLFGAAVAVALMPWNVALWWQARRLRFAIEMDCDARVLRAHPRPERYGMLLLTIAQRRSFAPSLFAPMLSEPTTQLERRIIAMRTTTKRLTSLTLIGATAAAVLALGVACSLQSPDKIAGPRPSAPREVAVGQKGVYFEFQVEKPASPRPGNLTPRYPDALRSANVEGEILAQFVLDTTGFADMSTFKVLKASHELFAGSVQAALPNMRFYPAEVGGRKVKQLVQMPFQFNLSKSKSVSSSARDTVSVKITGAVPARRQEYIKVQLDTTKGMAASTRASGGLTEVPVDSNKPTKPSQTYFEFQVNKAVVPRPGNPSPRYPDVLRSANVEGEVIAQFVLGPDGIADMSTIKILKSSHPLFTDAVIAALPEMRFVPAEMNGRQVRQLVQMPFKFDLSKQP